MPSPRYNPLVVVLLGALLSGVGCGGGDDAPQTGVRLVVRYSPTQPLEQLRFWGSVDASPVFGPVTLPEEASEALASDEESVVVLFAEQAAGSEVLFRVDGLYQGEVQSSGQGVAVIQAGEVVQLVVTLGPAAECGDGLVETSAEECDDGNSVSADGCSALCVVEPGYACSGEPSICVQSCGDGQVDPSEDCDDGNLLDDDGCAASCLVEDGYVCTGEPSLCTPVNQCGDGVCDLTGGEGHLDCPADCGWITIDAGRDHSCGLKGDGTVWCWGDNPVGQLGDSSTDPSLTPVQVTGVTDAVDVQCGRDHACALLAGGGVRCWGRNDTEGLLGNGTTGGFSAVPLAVATVIDALHLGVGGSHACATRADGTVWCWGANNRGQLGDATFDARSAPVQAVGVSNAWTLDGYFHTCTVTTTGELWCWGRNDTGQLGDGTLADQSTPLAVPGLPPIAAVGTGRRFTCAVDTAGDGWCWGEGVDGALGNGSTFDSPTPVQVSFPGALVQLTAGQEYACAARASDGTVWCWGDNSLGQLGDGSTGGISVTPVQAGALVGAVSLGVREHSCAALADGTAWCWGDNSLGQLGDGSTVATDAPVQVVDPY